MEWKAGRLRTVADVERRNSKMSWLRYSAVLHWLNPWLKCLKRGVIKSLVRRTVIQVVCRRFGDSEAL